MRHAGEARETKKHAALNTIPSLRGILELRLLGCRPMASARGGLWLLAPDSVAHDPLRAEEVNRPKEMYDEKLVSSTLAWEGDE